MKVSALSQLARRIVLLFCVALAGDLTTKFAQAEEFLPADFVSLFNGRDFTGWRFGDESASPKKTPPAWNIDQGVIIGKGDATAILASQWDYGDFEFEFDWKAGDDVDADLFVHAGRLLDADPIRITKSLAGGPQETDRGEGFYNASATGRIGGGGTASRHRVSGNAQRNRARPKALRQNLRESYAH